MKWQSISIETNYAAVEAVTEILLTAGADGVQIEESTTTLTVIAYYPQDEQFKNIFNQVNKNLNQLETFDIDASPANIYTNVTSQTDWENNWKTYYHSQRITRHFTVVPSWESFNPEQKDEYPIIMDPQLAFGTGTHETTKLMLQALETVVRGGESMIDVGTGSGVLAVAAKHLGVQDILATDIDEMSVEVAKENIKLNSSAGNIELIVSDLLEQVDIKPVDLIVANILADVIERLIPQTIPLLKKSGYFLVSGIYDDIESHITEELEKNGYYIVQKSQMGKWHSYIAKLKEIK